MQIGGLDPIKPEELKMPVNGTGEATESEKQLQQIKWLLVVLIAIMIFKNNK
jgi:hypothetical protein